MAAPSVADLVQTFAKGITRPESDEEGYLPYTANLNFVYARSTGTTPQRPIGVPAGWVYYDTTIAGFVGWDGASWVDVGGGGGSSLTEPTDPADDGKVAIADSGDLIYVAVSTLAGVASTVGLKFGATTIALNSTAPTSGNLLSYNGTNFVGVAPSTLTVSSAATAALATVASGLRTSTPTDLTMATIADGELLVRSGTTIDGISIGSLSVAYADYALGLAFGANIDNGATPTAQQLLYYDGSNITGIDPGNILRRKSNATTSTAAIAFTANLVETWNGSTTVSLTANLTGAIDGCEITRLFPAGSMNTFALSTDIDPTGLVAATFVSNLKAYLLRLKYHACGPCIEVLNFSEVTDL